MCHKYVFIMFYICNEPLHIMYLYEYEIYNHCVFFLVNCSKFDTLVLGEIGSGGL